MLGFLKKTGLFLGIFFLLPELVFNLIVPKISYHQNYEKAARLLPKIDEQTTLFIGASRTEWGIKPLVIERLTDRKVYNLAFPGSNGLDVLAYLKKHQIFPKEIIIGTAPLHFTVTNFDIENLDTSLSNAFYLNAQYQFKKWSYLYEKRSLEYFYKKEKPFFIKHKYDKRGGVVVKECGDYAERLRFQQEDFADVAGRKFKTSFEEYCSKMRDEITFFQQKGVRVSALIMPVCTELRQIEDRVAKLDYSSVSFDNVFDFRKYYDPKKPQVPDADIYVDCSHLSPEYAEEFSKIIARKLQ